MKKNLLRYVIIAVVSFGWFTGLQAQGITVVGNPTIPDIFEWDGNGALSGYSGTPIILNNSLVLEYNASSESDTSDIIQQLAVYTAGGTSLKLIPNPDGGQGVYFNAVQLIFQNKLFFIYLDVSRKERLASFDGTAITLYPNPDNGLGYIGSPRIYNNQLYVAYSNAAGVVQFGLFTGSGISLIANPDNSTVGFNYNYSVVYGGKIVSRYVTAAGPKQIATFDGTSWTVLPNPDGSTRGVYPAFPAAYHSKLYFEYYSATNQYQYMSYDSTGAELLIANPGNTGISDGGIAGFPIVYNDTLFFQYYNTETANLQLAKFGGTSISLVPNPDNTQYGFYNTPIVYNNNLYIFYVTADGTHHLTQYQTASDNLKVYPNPDGGLGYWDQPIVYANKLFFMYYNVNYQFQLGYFDGGSSLNLITSPGGYYNGAGGNNGYTGYPIIYNNLLYMQFGSVPYGNAGNLAYFDASVLPVSLLNFTVKQNTNASILQWKTANETNNAYFMVEHSSDGINFQPIGKVAGSGSSTAQHSYQFTDNVPVNGINYYRLKQVDNNGSYHYSTIETVTFNHITAIFKVSPNPTANTIQVSFSASAQASVLQVYNAGGVKVLEKQIAANQVTQSVSLSALAAGTYRVILIQGTQHQTINVVKQ